MSRVLILVVGDRYEKSIVAAFPASEVEQAAEFWRGSPPDWAEVWEADQVVGHFYSPEDMMSGDMIAPNKRASRRPGRRKRSSRRR